MVVLTVLIAFAALFIFSVVQTVLHFSPPICEIGSFGCTGPLFDPGTLVDLHVFTSSLERIDDWEGEISRGALVLRQSTTGLNPRETWNASLVLDAPVDDTWAHFTLVRAGHPPTPNSHKRHKDTRRGTKLYRAHAPRTEFEHLLQASVPLTRRIKPVRSKVHSLVTGEGSRTPSNQPASSNSSTWYLPFGLTVSSSGNLWPWGLAVFAACSFQPPSLGLAAVRIAALAAIAEPLWNAQSGVFVTLSRSAQRLLGSDIQTNSDKERDAVVVPELLPSPAVLHFKPRVTLRFAYDDRGYLVEEGRAGPMLQPLYQKLDWFNGMVQPTDARYSLLVRGDTVAGYAQPFYTEENLRLYELAPLEGSGGLPVDQLEERKVRLNLELAPLSREAWQMQMWLSENMKLYTKMPGLGITMDDLDDLKDFLRSGALRLILTYSIGFLQMMLSVLAFKSDIAFYHGREDYSGLSSRSLMMNFAISMTIFLYVCDSDFTSRLVKWPMGLEVAFDAWKIACRKRLGIQVQYGLPWLRPVTPPQLLVEGVPAPMLIRDTVGNPKTQNSLESTSGGNCSDGANGNEDGMPPDASISDAPSSSIPSGTTDLVDASKASAAIAAMRAAAIAAAEKKTDDVDVQGMRYLTFALVPMVVASSVHSLVTYRYKSFWSWTISSLADASYAFGFLNMCPQIFVNFNLKSVAHMPWETMIFKAFNTLIDDFIAFGGLIPMPDKHKWMTLRDDVVFLIFLYQRYLYPVDRSRPDEYGYKYKETETKQR